MIVNEGNWWLWMMGGNCRIVDHWSPIFESMTVNMKGWRGRIADHWSLVTEYGWRIIAESLITDHRTDGLLITDRWSLNMDGVIAEFLITDHRPSNWRLWIWTGVTADHRTEHGWSNCWIAGHWSQLIESMVLVTYCHSSPEGSYFFKSPKKKDSNMKI